MSGDRAAIIEAYRALLGRDPESDNIIWECLEKKSIAKVIYDIAHSPELAQRRPPFNPLWHHASTFNTIEIIDRHAKVGLEPAPGLVTNFLGLKIEEIFYMPMLEGLAGTVEPIPSPSNWHADIAGWAAALRAVELAGATFSVAELDCGWGPWIFNTGLAARSVGKRVDMIGVDGQEGHIAFAWRCADHNGFSNRDLTIHHGVVAAEGGTALLPRTYAPGGLRGAEPVYGADPALIADAQESGRWDVLRMITLDEVLGERAHLDLVHMDLQGREAEFIEGSRDTLDQHVAYLVVNTHSRIIEGRVQEIFAGSSWRLELERPALVVLLPGGPVTRVDGVQGWRNMALRPEA